MTRYRQIAQRLRIQQGTGKPDIVSERPRDKKTGRYLDLDDDGQSTTAIEIPDELIHTVSPAAVQPWSAASTPKGGKGAASG